MKNSNTKQLKSKFFVPAIILALTVILAGSIGIFWWPFGIAILFVGLVAAGLGLLGNKAAEEVADTE